MIPAVRKLGYRFRFSIDLKNEDVRTAGKLCIPVLISVASYQVHFLFGHSVALRFGTTAVMDYAQQLVQVFILTVVYAIAAVYFPKLSTLWAKKNSAGYNDSLKESMQFTLFLVLPAALGFFLLRFEIMEFLLSWRDSAYTDIYMAGNLMGLYAIGVIAIAFKEVADRAFYSFKDSKTPAIFGIVIMVVNVGVTLALIPVLGAFAMPVAYGVAAVVGSGGLLIRLNFKTRFVNAKFVTEIIKTALAAVAMFAVARFGRDLQVTDVGILNLIFTAVIGAAVYFAVAWVLKVSALRNLKF
jgi:putative peptidoglycan lipid II flippase